MLRVSGIPFQATYIFPTINVITAAAAINNNNNNNNNINIYQKQFLHDQELK